MTQPFDPSATSPSLDIRCNWCDKPMLLHTGFTTFWHRTLCALVGLPTAYDRSKAIRVQPLPYRVEAPDFGGWAPVIAIEQEMPLSEAREAFPTRSGVLTPLVVLRGETLSEAFKRSRRDIRAMTLTPNEKVQAWIQLLADYREEHRRVCYETPLTDSRCDLCVIYDSIPQEQLNEYLKAAR